MYQFYISQSFNPKPIKMEKKPLNQITTPDLISEIKKRKQLMYLMFGFLAVIVSTGIFLTVQQGFGVFTTIPVAFVPILILIRKNVSDAQKELESRK